MITVLILNSIILLVFLPNLYKLSLPPHFETAPLVFCAVITSCFQSVSIFTNTHDNFYPHEHFNYRAIES